MISTAFDREDVAEFERPLDGHSTQRATEMIGSVLVQDKPPLVGDGCELLCHEGAEAPAQARVDGRQCAAEGDCCVEVCLA